MSYLYRNINKKEGNIKFREALCYEEYLTIFQSPKAKVSKSGSAFTSGNNTVIFNEGKMFSFFGLEKDEI